MCPVWSRTRVMWSFLCKNLVRTPHTTQALCPAPTLNLSTGPRRRPRDSEKHLLRQSHPAQLASPFQQALAGCVVPTRDFVAAFLVQGVDSALTAAEGIMSGGGEGFLKPGVLADGLAPVRGLSPTSDDSDMWENLDFVVNPPVEAVVYGWGVNEDHQIGLEDTGDIPLPKVVDTLLGIRLQGRVWGRDPIVSGSRNSIAIDAQGQMLSWGWNARGTLGHGHAGEVSKPRRVLFAEGVRKNVRVRQVAVGGWHCLALDEDGQIYAWGGNEYRQCGIKTEHRDVTVATPVLPRIRAVMVSAGGMHSLALTEGGEVWMWGEPWGDFSLDATQEPRRVEIDPRDHVRKVCCGAFHNLALTADHTVLAWGTNDYGQLGLGATCAHTRNNKPTEVVGLRGIKVVDIHAGGWHNALITSEGLCYTWGRGEYGRLGHGDRSGKSAMQPTRVEGLVQHFVVQVACGGSHTMALTHEGRVFVWGRESFGRLGVATQRDAFSPVEVHLSGGSSQWRVIHISAGGRHSLAYALPLRGESPYASYRPTPRVSAVTSPAVAEARVPETSSRAPLAVASPLRRAAEESSSKRGEEAGGEEDGAEGSTQTDNTDWENPSRGDTPRGSTPRGGASGPAQARGLDGGGGTGDGGGTGGVGGAGGGRARGSPGNGNGQLGDKGGKPPGGSGGKAALPKSALTPPFPPGPPVAPRSGVAAPAKAATVADFRRAETVPGRRRSDREDGPGGTGRVRGRGAAVSGYDSSRSAKSTSRVERIASRLSALDIGSGGDDSDGDAGDVEF